MLVSTRRCPLSFQQYTHLLRCPLMGKRPSVPRWQGEPVSSRRRFVGGVELTRAASLTGSGRQYRCREQYWLMRLSARRTRNARTVASLALTLFTGTNFLCRMNAFTTQLSKRNQKNVPVKFSGFAPDPAILSELFPSIHTPHILIAGHDTGRAWNLLCCPIMVPALDCGVTGRLTVGGHEIHQLLIFPHACYQVTALTGGGLSTLKITCII